MERVQFQQEQMLAELKDFVQKGIFTKAESALIMKKRTAFETTLVRRIPKKADFLRYAAYEMGLEALRRKRVQRLKIQRSGSSVSDFCLTRRQFQIFERALKKFKDDVNLWVQYIQAAQRAGARALISRVCGRALQLHPNVPSLYILAAAHELKHLSHAAARVLLQRGIRLNSESVNLWREYVKMELGFVEALRRRWSVLGLIDDEYVQEQERNQNVDGTDMQNDEVASAPPINDDVNENDEQARKMVLKGTIVKTVISGAVEALPSAELFNAIHTVINNYPCPKTLRRSLLDHLYCLLHATFLDSLSQMTSVQDSFKHDPRTTAQMVKLYATRYLTTDLEGEALIDALRNANEELLKTVHTQQSEHIALCYTQFLEEWFNKALDEHINMYLLATLQTVCNRTRLPILLSTHLRLLRSPHNPRPLPPPKLLKLVRKYNTWAMNSQSIWLARLELEAAIEEGRTAPGANWRNAWADARRLLSIETALSPKGASISCSSSDDSPTWDAVWLWGLDYQASLGAQLHDQISSMETLLREARAEPTGTLCETLLVRYISLLREGARTQAEQYSSLGRVSTLYSPSASIWAAAFDIFAKEDTVQQKRRTSPSAGQQPISDNSDSNEEMSETTPTVTKTETKIAQTGTDTDAILRLIFEKWRAISASAHGAAALRMACHLMRCGHGREAARIVATARRALIGGDQKLSAEVEAFDKSWRDIIDGADEAKDIEPDERHDRQ